MLVRYGLKFSKENKILPSKEKSFNCCQPFHFYLGFLMRLKTFIILFLFLPFTAVRSEYLVPTIYKDRFMGKSSIIHVLNFESVSSNGYDKVCEDNCVMWVFHDSVVISGDYLIIGYTKERNRDIPMRIRFGDEIFSLTCKLTENAKSCAPSSKTLTGASLANKIRNFVGDFAMEFVQELPGTNRYRRDVWAAMINGIAPKKAPDTGIDDIDYSDLRRHGAKK